MKRSIGERIFEVLNLIILAMITLSIILPFMHIFAISVSSARAINAMEVTIWPVGFSWYSYKEFLTQKLFVSALRNTVVLTVSHVVLGLTVNVMAAYVFSRDFFLKRPLQYLFIIIMYFGGGLIPTYILITNTLGLYNNYLAFILPGLVAPFYIIIMRSQIEAIPPSLSEAAELDGATQAQVLFQIILPSIRPTLAAISLFLALGMWNMWYAVMLYTNQPSMWNLQYLLRSIVFQKTVSASYGTENILSTDDMDVSPLNYQMAAVIVVAAPIVCIYPFIQKYFTKGILSGSVKE